jgi:hypothetical protein
MKSAREVSKFRRVVAVLAAPEPLVYGDIIFGGASPLLSQALPMVDESPFATLPDSAEIPGENGASGAAARGALGAGSAVLAVPGLTRRRDETAVAAGTSASAAPVFSLRRAAREGGGRFEPVGRQAAQAAALAALPAAGGIRGLQAGSAHVPAGARAGADRRIDNPPQLAKLPHIGSDEGVRPLAGVGKLKHAPPMQAAGAALKAALEEVGRLADGLVSASPGEPSATASGNGVRWLEELPPQAGVGRLKPAPPLRTAMEEVGRMAGALVAAGRKTRLVGQADPEGTPPANRSGSDQELAGESACPTFLHEVSRAEPPAQQTANLRQSAPETHVSPEFVGEPDAEWLAALVNEALAEQARRHGVDLS